MTDCLNGVPFLLPGILFFRGFRRKEFGRGSRAVWGGALAQCRGLSAQVSSSMKECRPAGLTDCGGSQIPVSQGSADFYICSILKLSKSAGNVSPRSPELPGGPACSQAGPAGNNGRYGPSRHSRYRAFCYTTPRPRRSIDLFHQVILGSHLLDLVELGFDPVDMVFLFLQNGIHEFP